MRSDYVEELRAVLRGALETLERAAEVAAAAPPLAAEEKRQPKPQQDFLTLRELLELIGISYSTYRHLRIEGKMPPEIRLSKRTIKFSRLDVEAWERNAARSVA